eukprot:14455401-Ditylum_brightwellii.AAC.1
MTDAEVGSVFEPPVIPFISKPSTLEVDSHESNLCISATTKDNTYKFKVHTFSNDSPKDILVWEEKFRRLLSVSQWTWWKKPNKLSIKNTAARLRDVNGMFAKFLAPENNPMVGDELYNILY